MYDEIHFQNLFNGKSNIKSVWRKVCDIVVAGLQFNDQILWNKVSNFLQQKEIEEVNFFCGYQHKTTD